VLEFGSSSILAASSKIAVSNGITKTLSLSVLGAKVN
jgi:hypothetical protein